MRRLLPLAIAAVCLSAPPAGADPRVADIGLSVSSRHLSHTRIPGFQWLGLFAEGRRYTVARDGSGLDLQGGAYLQLFRSLSLRGGYRLFDYDGSEGDSSWETDHHGAILGFALSF